MLRYTSLTIISIVFILNLSASSADSAHIAFDSPTLYFEPAYEADGSFPIEFTFTNSGDSALVIHRIIAPGLSDVSFTKEPILPSQTAKISAMINPVGKTGFFDKKLMVFSNAINSPSPLEVKGIVVSGTRKGEFKYQMGAIALRQLQQSFGYIYKGDKPTQFLPVRNLSNKAIDISFSDLPAHLSIQKMFDKLAPNSTGYVAFTYNTELVDDWDFVIDRVSIKVKGQKPDTNQLIVSANIRENFLFLTEADLLVKPKATLPIDTMFFDTISHGKVVQVEFPVYNTGGRDLVIRAVKSSCGCTAAMPQKTLIPPGDSTHVVIEFNSSGFRGNNCKGVTLITNDPENYKQFLWLSGFIE